MEATRNEGLKELIMFYNVENLFAPDEKPLKAGSASGLRNWNEKKYQDKLFKLSHVVELIKEQEDVLPMLIGLSEIQGKQPLSDLQKLRPFSENYSVVHYDSMDERGVDVALMYDTRKLQLLSSEPITYFFEAGEKGNSYYDTTRDVLHCRLQYSDAIINVFVLHLPSQREGNINQPKRDYILKDLGERLKTIAETNEAIIVMGDFNENPTEENITRFAENGLVNHFAQLYTEKIFSTFHYKDGLLYDQILHSEHFLHSGFALRYFAAEVFRNSKISNWDRKFVGRPFRTYAGTRYLGGYSDHFPALLKLIKSKN